MVIIWIILGALLLWEIQSVWYAKHWDEELFVSLAFSRKSTVRGESCELLETIELPLAHMIPECISNLLLPVA